MRDTEKIRELVARQGYVYPDKRIEQVLASSQCRYNHEDPELLDCYWTSCIHWEDFGCRCVDCHEDIAPALYSESPQEHTAAQTHDEPPEEIKCCNCSEIGHPEVFCPNYSQEEWEWMMRDSYTYSLRQGIEKEPLPEAGYGHLSQDEKFFLIRDRFWSHGRVFDIPSEIETK